MGHTGNADWSWAARATARVAIPVIVNGDVRSGTDARRALEETGAAAVMVGRRAIEHPWVFREIRSVLDRGIELAPPTAAERIAMCCAHLEANVASRGEHFGVRVTRRHLAGYLKGLPGAAALRKALVLEDSLAGCLDILASAREFHPIWTPLSSFTTPLVRRLVSRHDVVLFDAREHQSNSPEVTLARQYSQWPAISMRNGAPHEGQLASARAAPVFPAPE